MRNDDLRTLAYKAFEKLADLTFVELMHKPSSLEDRGFTERLFDEAKTLGLLDFSANDDGEIRVFPLASKPPTQVAAVAGIDSHKGMGTK